MHYKRLLSLIDSVSSYLSVGLDVGADFTWMSIALPFILAQPCVFVKQLPGPILCALSCEEGPFIPKLQGQFA